MEDEVKRPPGSYAEFIDSVGWREATSEEYRDMPHSYTVRSKATAGRPPKPEWFDWFANEIRVHGYRKPFTNVVTNRTHVYTYLDAQDGEGRWHKYWAFQIIINREPLPAGPVPVEAAGRDVQEQIEGLELTGPTEEHP